MGDLLRGLGLIFSGGLDLVGLLLVIFIAALVLVLLVAPFESLQWWAAWVDNASHPPAASEAAVAPLLRSPAAPSPDRDCYVVFLPGVGALGTRVDAWEQGLVDVLARTLAQGTVLTGILPFDGADQRPHPSPSDSLAVAVARRRGPAASEPGRKADRLAQRDPGLRFHGPSVRPIYNLGVAEKLGRALADHGYAPAGRAPITLIVYSGAARVPRRRTPTWRAKRGQQ